MKKLMVVLLLVAVSLLAQIPPRSEAAQEQREDEEPRTHHFFDRNNLIGFSAMLTGVSLDVHSTCRLLRMGGREVIFPSQNCRTIGIGLYSFAAGEIGLAYLLHRSDHHKIERWIPRIQAIRSGIAATWNYTR